MENRKKYRKEYYRKNKDKIKKSQKKWREKNPEYHRKWLKDNPEYNKEYYRKRKLNYLIGNILGIGGGGS
ncbi:hypothetical protein ES705_50980 [subsurface metagenome]